MDKYQITFQTWNKIAGLYQKKFMDLDLYDDSYNLFCQQIPKSNPSILEIACGPGNITRYLLRQRPDFDILGIDIAPNMIELAKKNNPKANFKVMDCRALDQLNESYDAIICGFCMPYLSKEDCATLIQNSTSLLNENGILYFSTIEGDYQNSGFEFGSTGDRTFVYYYDVDHLKTELIKNQFKILHLIKKNYPKGDQSAQIHLIFIAQKITHD